MTGFLFSMYPDAHTETSAQAGTLCWMPVLESGRKDRRITIQKAVQPPSKSHIHVAESL
jgi:hypothetical protein